MIAHRTQRIFNALIVFLLTISSFALTSCGDSKESQQGTSDSSESEPGQEDGKESTKAMSTSRTTRKSANLSDAPLDAYRKNLVDLAFSAVCKFPTNPHEKNRCREQLKVVDTYIMLGQLKTARESIRVITNWRRALGLARLARHCVEEKVEVDVIPWLEEAERVIRMMVEDDTEQKWRMDRVRANIVATYIKMGDESRARALSGGFEPSERARLAEANFDRLGEADYEAHLATVDATMQDGEFEASKVAMRLCVVFHEMFYDNKERRELMARKLRVHAKRLPADIYVGCFVDMAGHSLDKKDNEVANSYLEEAYKLYNERNWRGEGMINLTARIGAMLYRSGREKDGMRVLNKAHSAYEEQRKLIIDMYRARTLRPLAESFVSIGRLDEAGLIYEKVIEEGATNPNARPHAVDLSATCRSMALNEYRPSQRLLDRMKAIHDGLDVIWNQ